MVFLWRVKWKNRQKFCSSTCTLQSNLALSLQIILESSTNPIIQHQSQCIESYGSSSFDPELHPILKRYSTDAIFLLLNPSLFNQGRLLLQYIRGETTELPILVVVEDCEPDKMLDLIKAGANDFITPPLRAIDVLPRLWRLIDQSRIGETIQF